MKLSFASLPGYLAILFWSTSVAFARSVSEQLGTLNTAFFNLLGSGLFLLIVQLMIYRKAFLQKLKTLPFTYFVKVGSFMVIYVVLFYLAVGEATSREAVIVVGIFNYLWPGFAFIFAVPILKEKAHIGYLILGVLIAFSGTVAAVMQGNGLSFANISSSFYSNVWPYLFAILAAMTWALYSNLTRKHQVVEDRVAIPVLFLIAALIILVIILLKGDVPRLNIAGSQILELLYIIIFPTALAYLFWDLAMKKGNKNQIVSFSYIIPLASTTISCIYLKVPIDTGFIVAAVLVIIGAIICKMAFKNQ